MRTFALSSAPFDSQVYILEVKVSMAMAQDFQDGLGPYDNSWGNHLCIQDAIKANFIIQT